MGNYFNECAANNLLQFIQQVTIEFRFRKSLTQEIFKSNLELRYQIIVLSIKFRKSFATFMIALFKKFLSLLVTNVNYKRTKKSARQFICLIIKIILHFQSIFLGEFESGAGTKSLKASGHSTCFAANNEGFGRNR